MCVSELSELVMVCVKDVCRCLLFLLAPSLWTSACVRVLFPQTSRTRCLSSLFLGRQRLRMSSTGFIYNTRSAPQKPHCWSKQVRHVVEEMDQ